MSRTANISSYLFDIRFFERTLQRQDMFSWFRSVQITPSPVHINGHVSTQELMKSDLVEESKTFFHRQLWYLYFYKIG